MIIWERSASVCILFVQSRRSFIINCKIRQQKNQAILSYHCFWSTTYLCTNFVCWISNRTTNHWFIYENVMWSMYMMIHWFFSLKIHFFFFFSFTIIDMRWRKRIIKETKTTRNLKTTTAHFVIMLMATAVYSTWIFN